MSKPQNKAKSTIEKMGNRALKTEIKGKIVA